MTVRKVNILATKDEIFDATVYSIREDLERFGGQLPERYVLVWHGYAAALQEWGLIDAMEYHELRVLLPDIGEPNPVMRIFSGWKDDDKSS